MQSLADYRPKYGIHGNNDGFVETAGAVLSARIHCVLRIIDSPIYKDHFVCHCGKLFSIKRLRETMRLPDGWQWAEEEHERTS